MISAWTADPRKPAIRLPLAVLSLTLVGSLVVCMVSSTFLSGAHWRNASQTAVRIAAFCALAAGYLRFVYVPKTTLRIDNAGIVLTQSLLTSRVAWTEIIGISESGWLAPTHRGGIAAGVTLNVKSGTPVFIPDVFSISRAELARKLRAAPSPV